MKKIISFILVFAFIAGLLVGCGTAATQENKSVNTETIKTDGNYENNETENKDRVKIVATIFPIYDWLRKITGDDNTNIELELLLDNGVDLHNYQPTSEDMLAISGADIFVYVGGHSDSWVDKALENTENADMVEINLFDVLSDTLKPLAPVEGMEHNHHDHDEEHHDHDHEHHDHDHEHHDHDGLNDEHVWLSIPRAIKVIEYITEEVIKLDSDNSELYLNNAKAYITKLQELDGEYRNTVKEARLNTVLFADRFPFYYLADDYNLSYFAAFTGCSAESEASFETVAFLAGKLDELDINSVITIEKCTHKIPETVIENTRDKDQQILVLNSLQSVTAKEIDAGLSYYDVMKSNLDTLAEALK